LEEGIEEVDEESEEEKTDLNATEYPVGEEQ
jgi:hypothetical protein